MIADQRQHGVQTGNITGEKIAMTIHVGAMAHVMDVMTKLYSKPHRAIIREYSTNAMDANIEAGRPNDPIHVTLPSALAPMLTITDTGVGLTVEDIHEIYSQYGASTKRGTNDQTGMLGMGCKSALAYTDQFTLVSVKDGVMVTVAIGRDETGAGSMTVVDTRSTSEADGTKVIVPAKREDIDRFRTEAEDFFQDWPAGSVFVNGAEPRKREGIPLDASTLLTINKDGGNYGEPRAFLVMGNVAYPVDNDRTEELGFSPYSGATIVRHVPIGSIEFTPSREALRYDSDKTVAEVKKLVQEGKTLAQAAIQAKIDQATDRWEAVKLRDEWSQIFQSSYRTPALVFHFQGQPIPTYIDCATGGTERSYGHDCRKASFSGGSHKANSTATTANMKYTLIAYNYTLSSFSESHLKKIKMVLDNAGTDYSNMSQIMLVGDKPKDTTWIPAGHLIDFKDVQAIKLPRVVNPNGVKASTELSYPVVDPAGHGYTDDVKASDIDTSRPIYWMGTGYTRISATTYRAMLAAAGKDTGTIVKIADRRREKFLRLFPNAIQLSTLWATLKADWLKKLTQDQKDALALKNGYVYCEPLLRNLAPHAAKIDDPQIVRACKLATLDVKALAKAGESLEVSASDYGDYDPDTHMESYPLLSSVRAHRVGDLELAHAIQYINMVYNA